jgi:hypothetical protein
MLIKVNSTAKNDAYRIRTENEVLVTVSRIWCSSQTAYCTCFNLVNLEPSYITSNFYNRHGRYSRYSHYSRHSHFSSGNKCWCHGIKLGALPAIWGEISAPVENQHKTNIHPSIQSMHSNLGSSESIPLMDDLCTLRTCLTSYVQCQLSKYCRDSFLKAITFHVVNTDVPGYKHLCNNHHNCNSFSFGKAINALNTFNTPNTLTY